KAPKHIDRSRVTAIERTMLPRQPHPLKYPKNISPALVEGGPAGPARSQAPGHRPRPVRCVAPRSRTFYPAPQGGTMQGRFEFEGSEVIPLVEETFGADERLLTEAQRYVAAGVDLDATPGELDSALDHPETGAPPGLWLMNDRGVYLRSNAARGGGERVAHARGYRSDTRVADEPGCEVIYAAPHRH